MPKSCLSRLEGVLEEKACSVLTNDLASERLYSFRRVFRAKVVGGLAGEPGGHSETTPKQVTSLSADTSSGSEDEGSVQGDSQGTPTSSQGSINMEHWISQAIHGSTTSTTSSSSTQSGGSGAAHRLADVMAQTHIGERPAGSRPHEPPCWDL